MARTKLSPERMMEIKKEYIGRIIIFCEGMTEKRYFDYFADIINKNKFNDIQIEVETVEGNAKTVFNFAEKFLSEEENNRKYSNYKKYLVFDCDDPPNIQQVILDMLSSDKEYDLLVSNYLFEVWLLMHFEFIENEISKRNIYRNLEKNLVSYYDKGKEGIIREIIQNGSVDEAIKNAYLIANRYKADGKSIGANINEMNPYTNVHIVVEQLIAEIS